MPKPNRGRQVLERNDHPYKAVRFGRVMRRPHLEHHLLFAPQIERLKMSAAAQIPYVHLMPVFAA